MGFHQPEIVDGLGSPSAAQRAFVGAARIGLPRPPPPGRAAVVCCPYLMLLLATHVLAACAVYRLLLPAGRLVALLALVIVLLLGAGWENLFWAFQIGTVGSAAAGLWALVAVRSGRPPGAAVAAILLLVALAFSGIGLYFVPAVSVAILCSDRPRRQLAVDRAAGELLRRLVPHTRGGGDYHNEPVQPQILQPRTRIRARGRYGINRRRIRPGSRGFDRHIRTSRLGNARPTSPRPSPRRTLPRRHRRPGDGVLPHRPSPKPVRRRERRALALRLHGRHLRDPSPWIGMGGGGSAMVSSASPGTRWSPEPASRCCTTERCLAPELGTSRHTRMTRGRSSEQHSICSLAIRR